MTADRDFDWRPSLAFMALVLVLLASKAGEIWTGTLPGNDDIWRLQQVRDLVAGQGWYNVDQSRFLTPEGGVMHWSRLPDLFLGWVIVVMTPILGQTQAEYVAVMVWPMTLLTVTMSCMVMVMRRLGAGAIGAALALLFFALSKSIYQFWPGRIDHHGLQLTLVVIALAALLSPKASRTSGAIAGLAVAAMLSVAMESLPYAAALVAAAGAMWVIRGSDERKRLDTFGAAIVAGGTLAYLLDAPGPAGARLVCDAYGAFHFIALTIGGVGLITLARLGGVFPDWRKRLQTGVAMGVLTVAAAITAQPQCLGSPYGMVPPEVMESWMSAVGEAKHIGTVWADKPALVIADIGYILLGLGAALFLVRRSDDAARLNWTILAVLIAFSGAVTAWQIRGSLFAHLFASLPIGYVTGLAFERWRSHRGPVPLVQFAAIAFLLSPPFLSSIAARVTPPQPATAVNEDGVRFADVCRAKEALAPLAALSAAKIFSPIDIGPAILTRTSHAVFAGPYHRNGQGILRVTGTLRASPEDAHRALLAMDADYVAYCNGLGETQRYATLSPGSFADQLNQGNIPAWLTPMPSASSADGALMVYRVESASKAPVSRPDS
ncbi:MAG: hypothetical protein AAGJ32_06175 [Pseudomonadota bacterium]